MKNITLGLTLTYYSMLFVMVAVTLIEVGKVL